MLYIEIGSQPFSLLTVARFLLKANLQKPAPGRSVSVDEATENDSQEAERGYSEWSEMHWYDSP